jgi:glucosylceramidase
MAHAAKFVRPGSVRIASNYLQSLPNVAFKTPDGKRILIVLNNRPAPQTFNIHSQDGQAVASLNGGAVGTYLW